MAAPANAKLSEVVPGVTYERVEQPGQVIQVTRVVQGPRVSVRPVMAGGAPTRRARLTDAMAARLGDGAVVGVNGDYFNLENAYPSGLLISNSEIVSEPEATRSALMFTGGGSLTSGRVELAGKWQAGPDPSIPAPFIERGFVGVNRPAERSNETIVYTPRYGDVTPTGNRVDALIAMDPPGVPTVNQPLVGTVQTIQPGGGVGIGPGKLVISGVGTAGNNVLSDLVPGRRVTITFAIPGVPPDTPYAIGGGPALVSNGVALTTVSEGFTSGQIGTRTSRTAVGQTADGTVLLVTVEGPLQGSRGMTMAEQAALLASLGAQTAVGMDGGGSAMMALRDRLVTPWSSERAIANAVVVVYSGVQLTQPTAYITPNGDGIDESTRTVARSAKAGAGRIILADGRGRAIRELYRGPLGPGGYRVDLGARTLRRDGAYRVIARLTPDDGSGATSHTQSVVADRTLGFLKLRKVGKKPKIQLRIGFRLSRAARVTLLVKDAKGKSVKLLLRNRRAGAGRWSVPWDLKRGGKPLKPGIYTVIIRARTPYGEPTLLAKARVAATKPKPKKS
jgi:hypothetical protein